MAKLTYKEREKLPSSAFIFPGERAYPIDTEARARNALARVSAFGTPAEKARVRAAVHSRYPGIEIGEMKGVRVKSKGRRIK